MLTTSPPGHDHYPSRCEKNWKFIARKDPVVYGDSASGPLTSFQLESYENNGFICLQEFFDEAETKELQIASSKYKERLEKSKNKLREIIYEPDGNAVRSVFSIHMLDRFFTDLCKDHRLAGIARQLLGSNVYIHQSRINFKPGFSGKEFYWHSDFETWHVEDGMPRMRAVSCSVLLSENNEFNGPLMLIPGSHRKFVTCVGETPEDHYKKSLRRQEYGVPSADALETLVEESGISSFKGPAGSVVFFECNTMHGSTSNISPYPRNNVFFVYNSMENTLEKPFCGLDPRPEFLAHRRFTPVRDL